MIINTAKAAYALNHPSDVLLVLILDDSCSAGPEKKMRYLENEVLPQLLCTSRRMHVETHSRVANLNFGLRHVERPKHEKIDFVAVLDVDMIPEPNCIQ